MKIIDGHKLIEKLRKYHHENVSVDGLETLIDQSDEEHTMEEYMMGQEGNPDDGSL